MALPSIGNFHIRGMTWSEACHQVSCHKNHHESQYSSRQNGKMWCDEMCQHGLGNTDAYVVLCVMCGSWANIPTSPTCYSVLAHWIFGVWMFEWILSNPIQSNPNVRIFQLFHSCPNCSCPKSISLFFRVAGMCATID